MILASRSGLAARWHRHRFGLGAGIAALCAASLLAPSHAASPEPPEHDAGAASATGTAGTGRYVVAYNAQAPVDVQDRALRSTGGEIVYHYDHAFHGAAVVATPAEIAAIAGLPGVVSVLPDVPVAADEDTPTDPGFDRKVAAWQEWALDRIDQRALPGDDVYSPTHNGEGVSIYIIDGGIRSDHTEFTGRIVPGMSVLDDGRGTEDCKGHGTHVAGIAAGASQGVAPAASLIPVRVLNCEGKGPVSHLLAGLDWVIDHHDAGTPAVANISIAVPSSSFVTTAVENLIADGVSVTVSAGNNSTDACASALPAIPATLAVAASDARDKRAWGTNTGPCVDLFAPGVYVQSAAIDSPTALTLKGGTSMAAPYAAGAAALLLHADPTLTPAQVSDRLLSNTTPDVILDPGTPDTPNRLLYVPHADVAPAAVRWVGARLITGNRVAVRWKTATESAIAPTLRLRVEVLRGIRDPFRVRRYVLPPTQRRTVITDLAPGHFWFRVRTINEYRSSESVRTPRPLTTRR